MNQWISQVFSHEELLGMGHDQRAEDLNLGLGWLYSLTPAKLPALAGSPSVGGGFAIAPSATAKALRLVA